jgi:hypothetical protein
VRALMPLMLKVAIFMGQAPAWALVPCQSGAVI